MSTAHQMPGGTELTAALISADARSPTNIIDSLSNSEYTGAESTRHSALRESLRQLLLGVTDVKEELKRLEAQCHAVQMELRLELARSSRCGPGASGFKPSLAPGQASCQGALQSGATQDSGHLDAHGAVPPQACGDSRGAIAADVGVQSQQDTFEGGEPVKPMGEVALGGSGLPSPTSATSDRHDELHYQVADIASVETEEEDESEDLARREGAPGQPQREAPVSDSRQTTNGQAEEGPSSTAGSHTQVGTSVLPE
jgi:hypothetical protein